MRDGEETEAGNSRRAVCRMRRLLCLSELVGGSYANGRCYFPSIDDAGD